METELCNKCFFKVIAPMIMDMKIWNHTHKEPFFRMTGSLYEPIYWAGNDCIKSKRTTEDIKSNMFNDIKRVNPKRLYKMLMRDKCDDLTKKWLELSSITLTNDINGKLSWYTRHWIDDMVDRTPRFMNQYNAVSNDEMIIYKLSKE